MTKPLCSFCGSRRLPGEVVTGRDGAFICRACVDLAKDALEQAHVAELETRTSRPAHK